MAKRDQQELSQESVERINRVIRSLVEDRVERGIDLDRPMRCDSCGAEKASAGSALYGAYKLCNDCLLEFTLDLASGEIGNVADFMTRRGDGTASLPEPGGPRERYSSTTSLNPLTPRDSLRPSNEPC